MPSALLTARMKGSTIEMAWRVLLLTTAVNSCDLLVENLDLRSLGIGHLVSDIGIVQDTHRAP